MRSWAPGRPRLFAPASTALFLKSLAGGAFLALATGVFLDLYRMAKRWGDESPERVTGSET
jgi:hypothetical protein